MPKSYDVNYSFKLRKGGKIHTRELQVLADDAHEAKRMVISEENRGCYRFRINSVILIQKK